MTDSRRVLFALVALCALALTARTSHASPAPTGSDDGQASTVRLRDTLPRPAVPGTGHSRGRGASTVAATNVAAAGDLVAAARHGGGKGAAPMSLTRAAQARGDCTAQDLAAGRTNGQLADGDCRWGQLTGLADVSLVDVYRVRSATRQRVRLTGQSADFGVLLSVRDARYRPVVDAAAGGAGQNATVDVVLPAGTYMVFVTNAGDGAAATGAYRLDATLSPEDVPAGCAAVAMTAGETKAGNLGPSGCYGYDYLPRQWLTGDAAMYSVSLSAPGTLTLDVAATGHVPPRLAVLTRTGLTSIDATFGATNPDAATRLTVALPEGHFLVLVYADGTDQAGAFSLTSSFASAANACRPAPAAVNTDVVATLDTDCRLAYLNMGDYSNNAADLHQLTVPQDSTVTIGLKTRGFNGHAFIFDELSQQVVDGWVDDGFRAALPPGIYHVAVFSESAAIGGYTVRFDVEPIGTPCQVQPLAWGTPVNGVIDGTDCGFRDFNAIFDYPQGVDVFVLDVPVRGEIEVNLRSTAIDSYLVLLGGPLVRGDDLVYFVSTHDDIDALRDTNARLKIPLWPGRYLLAALSSTTANGKGAGAYQLDPKFTPQAAPGCETQVLGPNAQQASELAGTECRVFDRDPTRYSVSLQDRYRIDVPSAGVLTIFMNAPSFSPRIQVSVGPYGDPIGADQDPNQVGRDALMQFVAEAGSYWLDVEAAVRTQTVTGAYTLQTTFQARATCDAITDLDPLPADRTGAITAEDCLLGDPPLFAQLMSPVDYYRFTLTEVGKLTIDMTSTAIDPALYLVDARWGIVAANANLDEVDANSQLLFDQIAPGTYVIAAISTDPGQFGAYRLKVAFEPSALVIPTPGTMASATPTSPEPTPRPSDTPPGAGGTIYLPYGSRLFRLR